MNKNAKTVLVTGASGFIGSHLIARLKSEKYKVYAVSRKKTGIEDQIEWLKADLVDLHQVESIFNKVNPNLVYHLAGEVTGSRDTGQIIPTFQGILLSTIHVLSMAHKYKVERVILAGSMEESMDESAPVSPYAAAKKSAALYARMFHSLYKLPVVIARLFMVYGPSQKDMNKLIPYTIATILDGKKPHYSNGKRKIDWIYIDDVINALMLCATVKDIEGKEIDIGTGKETSIKQIVEKLHAGLGYTGPSGLGERTDRQFEIERVANSKEAFKVLKWKALTSLQKGLMNTIEAYKKERTQSKL